MFFLGVTTLAPPRLNPRVTEDFLNTATHSGHLIRKCLSKIMATPLILSGHDTADNSLRMGWDRSQSRDIRHFRHHTLSYVWSKDSKGTRKAVPQGQ